MINYYYILAFTNLLGVLTSCESLTIFIVVSLKKVDVNRNSYKFELKWSTDFNWSIKFTTLIDSYQLYSILNFEIRLTGSGCLKVDEFRVHQVIVLKLTLKTPWHFFNFSSIAVFPNNFDFVKKMRPDFFMKSDINEKYMRPFS